MKILKDNKSSLGPKGMEEEQVSLFETGEPMDDLFGSADELEGAFDEMGEEAENEDMGLFLSVIKGDVIDIKVQSFCTE